MLRKIGILVVGSLALLLMLTVLLFTYFSPVFHGFPKPSGKFSVGLVKYHLKDDKAKYQSEKRRSFSVDVFYPIHSAKNSHDMFFCQQEKIKALQSALSSYTKIPQIIWKFLLSGIKSYARYGVKKEYLKQQYPVIIYLPGIGGIDLHNLYLEEIASHGYVVVAIEPPYDTWVTVLPNNQTAFLDPVFKDAMSRSDRKAIYEYRNQAHDRWAKYVMFVVNWLKYLSGDSSLMWYEKLDMSRLGIMGHSHGGAVALDMCQKGGLFKAGINMDGFTKTYNSAKAFATPFLWLLSEQGYMPEMHDVFGSNKRPDFLKKTINQATHGSFTDHILLKYPFGDLRKSIAERVRQNISRNIVEFFKEYLA